MAAGAGGAVTVYVLVEFDHGGDRFAGVFATRAAAERQRVRIVSERVALQCRMLPGVMDIPAAWDREAGGFEIQRREACE